MLLLGGGELTARRASVAQEKDCQKGSDDAYCEARGPVKAFHRAGGCLEVENGTGPPAGAA